MLMCIRCVRWNCWLIRVKVLLPMQKFGIPESWLKSCKHAFTASCIADSCLNLCLVITASRKVVGLASCLC